MSLYPIGALGRSLWHTHRETDLCGAATSHGGQPVVCSREAGHAGMLHYGYLNGGRTVWLKDCDEGAR